MKYKSREQIAEKLTECIHENFPRAKSQNIDMNDDLYETGIIDSLGFLTIIVYMENTFNIVVNEIDVIPENFSSINSMADYVVSSLDGEVAEQ